MAQKGPHAMAALCQLIRNMECGSQLHRAHFSGTFGVSKLLKADSCQCNSHSYFNL